MKRSSLVTPLGFVALGTTVAFAWISGSRPEPPATRPFVFRMSDDSRYLPCPRDVATWFCSRPGVTSPFSRPRTPASDLARQLLAQAIEPRGAAQAIRGLRQRQLEGDNSPATLHDLAIALLLAEPEARSKFEALDLLTRTEHAEASSPQTAFNLALLLEHLGLIDEARQAWLDHQAREHDPQWLAEGDRHLRELALSASVRAFQGSRWTAKDIDKSSAWKARRWTESQGIRQWAEAVEKLDSDALETAARDLLELGEALARHTGDPLFHDTAKALQRLTDPHQPATQELARAFGDYAQGRALYEGEARLYDQARPALDRARDTLRRFDVPFAVWADFYSALCIFHGESRPQGARALDRLLGELEPSPYRVVRGYALWARGLAHYFAGELAPSDASYLAAISDFETTGESEGLAAVRIQLSLNLLRQHRTTESWSYRESALRLLPEIAHYRRRTNLFHALVQGSLAEGWHAAAMRFQSRLDAAALSSADPLIASSAWRRRTELAHRSGLDSVTEAALDEATTLVANISGAKDRALAEAQVSTLRGEHLTPRDPELAELAFREASEKLHDLDRPLEWMRSRGGLARAVRDSGRLVEAREILAEAVSKGLSVPIATDHREAFFAQAQSLLDELIDLDLDLGNIEAAFLSNETSRGLALRAAGSALKDAHNVRENQPIEIARQLPDSTVLITYRFLAERLVAWTMRSGSLQAHELGVTAGDLETSLVRMRRHRHRGASRESRAVQRHLYRQLVEPFADRLENADTLIVQPDRLLNGVPFDALIDVHDRWLVEEFTITLAPTIALWQARKPIMPGRNAVLVGDPAFDPGIHPQLERLRWAELEARRLAEVYPTARLLTGSEAGEGEITRALETADILHLASHAVHDPQRPHQSALVLAGPGAGLLRYEQLASRSSIRPGIVVLAACESGAPSALALEGNHNLAEAFLLAGSRAVVATLWPVADDATTAGLMLGLHQGLAEGMHPVDALTAAKRQLLRSADEGYSNWAVFQIMSLDQLK